MQTTNDLAQSIGEVGNLSQGGLSIDVRILNAKQVYGCTRFLVSPIAGHGEVWVSADRVQMYGEQS